VKNRQDFKIPKVLQWVAGFSLMIVTVSVYAEEVGQDLSTVASTLISNFAQLAQLIIAGAYVAGAGFAVSAILKFKQHKDNPTQIPIGTPIAVLFVAGALLFLPNIMKTAGATLFGNQAVAGGVAGVADISDY